MRYLMIVGAAILISCEEDTKVDYSEDEAITLENADSFLQIETSVVGFTAGLESYSIAFNAINGVKDIDQVNIYSTFTDVDGSVSNEVLFGSYPVEETGRNQITDDFTYDDLKEGIIVNDESLPTDQTLLAVGAGWEFRFEGVRSSGEIIRLPGTINIAVLSRFAGIYKMTYMEYYRINVLRDDVTDPVIGEEIYIGSVDEDTFSHNDWWGPFSWSGCSFNFDVDFENGNAITVPILTSCGLYAGTEAISCPNFDNIPCVNVLEVHDDTGEHVIKMSYGYEASGGAREFYVEYEKVVD